VKVMSALACCHYGVSGSGFISSVTDRSVDDSIGAETGMPFFLTVAERSWSHAELWRR
jgi:hypothetical protein